MGDSFRDLIGKVREISQGKSHYSQVNIAFANVWAVLSNEEYKPDSEMVIRAQELVDSV